MCGLVGYLGDSSLKTRHAFEDMFQMDVVRGKDSCGIAIVRNKHLPTIIKDITLPTWLLEESKYTEIVGKFDYTCLIGHNRWATKGKVNIKNAHPFRSGNIIMAHNGTLDRVYHLPDGNKFDTDSEALCNSIAKQGIEWTWKNVVGAAAITYYDLEKKTFNIISNGKRPIYWMWTADKSGLFWGSEPDMIRLACRRRDVKLEDNGKAWFPPDDTLFTFKIERKEVTYTSKKLDPYVFTFQPTQGANDTSVYRFPYGDFEDENIFGHEIHLENLASTQNRPVVMGPKATVPPQDPYEQLNVRTKFITEAEFEKDFDRCIFCNTPLVGDFERSVITDYDKHLAVCSDCADTADCQGQELEGKLL